ncbi:MAG: leucine-rich repeat domain-containing protein [Fimbriiglobus sp.]
MTMTDPPSVDREKLLGKLSQLGVEVSRFGEVTITEAALTPTGDAKPGLAESLAKLQDARRVIAFDLPAFGVGMGKAIAAIPGLTGIDLWRTKATPEALAAFGACSTLESLDLNNGSGDDPVVTDVALKGFAGLKNVRSLTCQRGTMTGNGLAAIAGFSKLEELNLEGCSVDDAAVPHLAKLTSLKSLTLSETKISPAKLVGVLKGLPKLTFLSIDGTAVTDADAKPLAELPLVALSIGRTGLTDAGAKVLATSKTLVDISLHDTKVTDAGIVAMAAMPKLRGLTLFRLPLTDKSLDALEKSPELTSLWLGNNQLTPARLAQLKAARPKVFVHD